MTGEISACLKENLYYREGKNKKLIGRKDSDDCRSWVLVEFCMKEINDAPLPDNIMDIEQMAQYG